MPTPSAEPLCRAVQDNCDIADARHAGAMTMCVYLMKMREYFRWEMGLDFDAALPRAAVGEWIQARERRWQELDEAEYRPVAVGGRDYDPFDADAINRVLLPAGYVYSAGLGLRGAPHFFLGRLSAAGGRDGVRIYQAREECARDLAAPPAMSRGRTVFVRRESLRRMLWERLQEWRWSRRDNALGQALACYDFDGDLEGALDAMTEREARTAVLHELGEVEVGGELGAAWGELLCALPRGPAELGLRALRDHWADCRVTLPALLDAADRPALLFYRAGLTGLRRQLFPSLAAGFERWAGAGDDAPLRAAVARGRGHWGRVARRFARAGEAELAAIEAAAL